KGISPRVSSRLASAAATCLSYPFCLGLTLDGRSLLSFDSLADARASSGCAATFCSSCAAAGVCEAGCVGWVGAASEGLSGLNMSFLLALLSRSLTGTQATCNEPSADSAYEPAGPAPAAAATSAASAA